jgi:hypothetical protein
MTDTAALVDHEAARLARLDALAQRRTAPATDVRERAPRASIGQGSKVAAVGAGVATMLGLVAAMGWADRPSTDLTSTDLTSTGLTATVAAPTPAPAQVVVVIHPAGGSPAPAIDTSGAPTAPTAPGSVVVPSAPIVLTAQPTVRQAPVSTAPTGQTNGSR